MTRKLSKQTVLLILVGNLCFAVPYLVNKTISLPGDFTDFTSGFGVAMIFMSLVIAGNNKNKRHHSIKP